MALDPKNSRVAVTGAVYVAPLGTTAPTTASSVLPVAWKDLGYMNEDGIVETLDRSAEDLRAWQNNAIVRTIVTESALRFNFTAIETKKDVLEAYYGAPVTGASNDTITIDPNATGGRKAWVVDILDGSRIERTFIAEGEVTETGERTLVSTDLVGYPMTVTAYSKAVRTFSTGMTFLGVDSQEAQDGTYQDVAA